MSFHINPKTGEPGSCNAMVKCPFGGPESHYPSAENARAAYELSMGPAVAEAKTRATQKVQAEEQAYLDFVTDVKEPARTLESLKTTPTEQDMREGLEFAARKFAEANRKTHGWDTVMGDRARRTERRLEEYNAMLRSEVLKDEAYRAVATKAATRAAARDAYARAWEAGIPVDPAVHKQFEQLWYGNVPGNSYKKLVERGEELQKMKQDLQTGTITPARVVGTGYHNPSKVAHEYIDKELNRVARAIQTRGRSDTLNVDNMKAALSGQAGDAVAQARAELAASLRESVVVYRDPDATFTDREEIKDFWAAHNVPNQFSAMLRAADITKDDDNG